MIEYIYEPKRIHGTFDEVQTQEIHERVKANLATIPESTCELSGTDRLAAQHFFSQMTWLEKIASMAADKHEIVEGQLLDEAVHLLSFYSIAEHFGGLIPANKKVQALLDYIDKYEGVKSLILLNFFGESWIDKIFERVGTWGFADGLLESIEEDEERHHQGAMDDDTIIEQLGGMPDKSELTLMTRDLEKLLSDIMASPHFSFPMIYFGGQYESAMVGLDICAAHEEVCDELGIEPKTGAMRAGCRAQRYLSRKAPEKAYMTNWETSKMNLWNTLPEMTGWFECPLVSSNPTKIQLDLMRAVSHVLFLNPHLNRVVRNNQIYQLQENVVGQRFLYDSSQISTVFINNAWRNTRKQLLNRVSHSIKKTRSKAYETIPYMMDIVDILPPSRCAVTLNYNGFFGHCVKGPLNPIEGVPTQLMVGEVYEIDGKKFATVTVTMDHRVGDGRDISMLGKYVCDYMENLIK